MLKSSSKTVKPPRAIRRLALCLSAAAAMLLWFGTPAPAAKDDWLPISPEDLALKDNPKSPGAHAMILYRESSVDAHQSSDDEYFRIKIFTQEGVKEGDVEIPFVKGLSDIKDLRARTIRPDGSIVNFEGKPFEKTVVKVSGFKFLAKTFTLPDVQPGCIIEYKYRDQSDPHLYYDNSWEIQGDLYTRLARFSIKPDTTGIAPPLAVRSYLLSADDKIQKQSNGYYTLEVRDLPGIEEEEFMPPEKTLKASVEFFYRARNFSDKETPQQFWEHTGKVWNGFVDEFVNKKGALESEVSRIVSPGDSPETKLRKIYARVQQVRNLSFEEEKSEKEEKQEKLKPVENVEDILKHGYASGRQINYLLIGLARAAGFEAMETYIAPRNVAFFMPASLDSSQLNEDVVWIRAGTQEYYLDPGARYFPFGLLPWYEAGTKGIRIGKQGLEMIDTALPMSTDSTLVRHADLSVDEDGGVAGTIEVDFTGQNGALHREDGRDEDEAGRKKSLEDEIKTWLPPGSTFELTKMDHWDDIQAPLHVEGTAKSPAYATPAGRRMLLPLEFFQSTQAGAFQSEKRVNDIYFHFPFEEQDDVLMHVPASYKIETSPPPQNVDRGAVKYQISAEPKNGTLEIKRHLVVSLYWVKTNQYPALRSFFGTVKKNDDSDVVLQNAGSSQAN
jgi:hypothetical protein